LAVPVALRGVLGRDVAVERPVAFGVGLRLVSTLAGARLGLLLDGVADGLFGAALGRDRADGFPSCTYTFGSRRSCLTSFCCVDFPLVRMSVSIPPTGSTGSIEGRLRGSAVTTGTSLTGSISGRSFASLVTGGSRSTGSMNATG
jgi:hypothetical protein